ncbi:sugar transferase [Candidatus Saccharibacteria bacterium]|nr:sugar transferase [Candidatus Saccharibacteria bacterium]
MKRNPNFVFHVCLALGDILALLASFTFAYILRVTLTDRPFVPISSMSFIMSIVVMIPIWLAVFFFFDLYDGKVYKHRVKELGRLLLASIVSMTIMISFAYFTDYDMFPAKLVPIYALLFSFVLLLMNRWIIKGVRGALLRRGKGALRAIIVGDSPATRSLIREFVENRKSNYKIVAIVANAGTIPEKLRKFKYGSVASAIAETKADIIVQTDDVNLQKNYQMSVDNHLRYMFVPDQEFILSGNNEIEFLGTLPTIQIKTTPLMGYGRLVKRVSDIVFGGILAIVSSPVLLVLMMISKLSSPKDKVFFKQKRLSIYGKKIYVYKLRSMKSEYCNISPEEAFAKMGKPELGKKYRANGDQLKNDPRVTKFGKFLRATSLDELPQVYSVLKGTISLVGPRALVPGELNKYPNKNLILSVKSGLTGLAQVSGRRDISFEERRNLDVYYVQNWSFLLDLQIMLQTAWMVVTCRGAK